MCITNDQDSVLSNDEGKNREGKSKDNDQTASNYKDRNRDDDSMRFSRSGRRIKTNPKFSQGDWTV